MTTRAEQETIIRWDREDSTVRLFTADAITARRWTKLGYDVQISDRDRDGQPRCWQATAPAGALRLRRLVNGQIVKRAGRQDGAFRSKVA